jgi:hypothetical protein
VKLVTRLGRVTLVAAVAAVTIAPASVGAQHKSGTASQSPPPAPQTAKKQANGGATSDGSPTTVDPKTGQKSKQYNFTGLDIDGKLKTPQLLYFLNRMKSEFDTTAPDKRSFLPELKRSTDDM